MTAAGDLWYTPPAPAARRGGRAIGARGMDTQTYEVRTKADGSLEVVPCPTGQIDPLGAWEGQTCPKCGKERISYTGAFVNAEGPQTSWLCLYCGRSYRVRDPWGQQPTPQTPAAPQEPEGPQEYQGVDASLHTLAAVLCESQRGNAGQLEAGTLVRWVGQEQTVGADHTVAISPGDVRAVVADCRNEGVWLTGRDGKGVYGAVARDKVVPVEAVCYVCSVPLGFPQKEGYSSACYLHGYALLGLDSPDCDTKAARLAYFLGYYFAYHGGGTAAQLAQAYYHHTGEDISSSLVQTQLRQQAAKRQLDHYVRGQGYWANSRTPRITSQEWAAVLGEWVALGYVRGGYCGADGLPPMRQGR